MFMLEYSIAVQNAELDRLKKLAESEERKLNIAEQCLEQDAALFDEFLKDNDKSSIEAITNAEQEARKRSAIVDEIRQLSVQQQKLTAENNRLRSVVQEYRGYKLFLECLVPEPHRSGRQLIRQERRLAKARAREEARRKLTVQPPLSVPPDIRRRTSFMVRRKSTLRPSVTSKSPTSVSSSPRTPRASSSIDEEQLVSSSDETEEDLFFTSVDQVLEILADLEEANLRLLRHCQDGQEGIDSLKTISAETKERVEADNSVLVRHYQALKESIRVEEEKSKDLSVTSQDFEFAGFEKKGQEAMLQELHNHIGEVYRTCIQKPDASLSSLQLLNEIESRMIALLQQISELPSGEVKAALHTKERKHRLDVKERRRQEQQRHQEERLRKTLERAQAEPKRMHGRKIVARSEPPKMSKDDSKDLEALAREEEEMRVLFG
ncbi:Cilia- and flagella-associated protein 100, variant 2 [Clonorchis sinensis]|nr:Cilia- and flagella-associated protein 100, variant 2 [Clonorchis sinensis]